MTIDAEVAALRKVPLFAAIDPGKLRLLAFISERVRFRDGEELCHQGDRGEEAFIVLSGRADVIVDAPGGERKVAEVQANEIVGEISVLCDTPRTATVRASGDVEALMIGKEPFLRLLQDAPHVGLEIMRVLARRLESTTQDLAEARLAAGGPV